MINPTASPRTLHAGVLRAARLLSAADCSLVAHCTVAQDCSFVLFLSLSHCHQGRFSAPSTPGAQVLMVHIPLSLHEQLRPHRGFVLCGDPSWGRATDRSWRDERRKPWPKGNQRSTELFLEAVLAAGGPGGPLLAVLAGHTHGHDATAFRMEAAARLLERWGQEQEGGMATGAVQ